MHSREVRWNERRGRRNGEGLPGNDSGKPAPDGRDRMSGV
ncbi:hypothetical protein SFOMI_1105 [Sphingobium fuliginis]|uniref:Uncharacterized protein n=1 Tax=Sphingobium fuliginis (strain ATCC 27551) TaxID=336203 RepID=A0A292ZCG9_SPHSA|nr:hypothetical protein SFOMI_1105 [Sphingobium fuliginis]